MHTTSQRLILIALCAGALAACDQDGSKTAGQKMDAAVAESKTQAKEAGAAVEKKLDAAGQALDDTSITAKVKAKLVADDQLKALDIQVDTKQGEVTLEGTAPSEAARDSATRIAMEVGGVKTVNNKLRVGT
jgi:hyperosmotically inducible protein